MLIKSRISQKLCTIILLMLLRYITLTLLILASSSSMKLSEINDLSFLMCDSFAMIMNFSLLFIATLILFPCLLILNQIISPNQKYAVFNSLTFCAVKICSNKELLSPEKITLKLLPLTVGFFTPSLMIFKQNVQ